MICGGDDGDDDDRDANVVDNAVVLAIAAGSNLL